MASFSTLAEIKTPHGKLKMWLAITFTPSFSKGNVQFRPVLHHHSQVNHFMINNIVLPMMLRGTRIHAIPTDCEIVREPQPHYDGTHWMPAR
jgi:hypothetical protein